MNTPPTLQYTGLHEIAERALLLCWSSRLLQIHNWDSSMPAWLIPVLKTILPNVASIVSAAAPIFTRKSADAVANQTMLLQQQITELQAAASENDAHIKKLAAQIQSAVAALEEAASIAERRHQRILFLCVTAAVLSVTSLCTALFMLVAR
jgi:hypothetical protein